MKIAINALYGDLGVAKIAGNFMIKFWNIETKVFILAVGRENEEMITNSLIFMNEIINIPCRIRILHVSGTLLKIEENMKQKNESWLQNHQKQLEIQLNENNEDEQIYS